VSDQIPTHDELQAQVTDLTRRLDEAAARERAVADVLRIISGSPADIQRTRDTVTLHHTVDRRSPYGGSGNPNARLTQTCTLRQSSGDKRPMTRTSAGRTVLR
jgi:hypothetical protein